MRWRCKGAVGIPPQLHGASHAMHYHCCMPVSVCLHHACCQKPAFDSLYRYDFVVATAAEVGIRLVLPVVSPRICIMLLM